MEKLRGARYSLNNIIGSSPAILGVKEHLTNIAKGDSTVLITGETGTGKELFAHAIHLASKRRFNHFIKINCAAIPDELMESELFGYESGAFTGARKGGKPGKVELAHMGTLFLDEIGELSLRLQAKLLRFLQEGEIEKVGGTAPVTVDVRVIAATNKDLEREVQAKRFREDLYYRLNVAALHIPPLRERREDIPLLVKHFIEELNERLGVKVKGIESEVEELFQKYSWPGNVRELQNVLERTINTIQKEIIEINDVMWFLPKVFQSNIASSGKLSSPLRELELKAIKNALEACGGNKTRAAALLGVHRSTIYNKLKKMQSRK